jgi:hypothetical protein
VASGTSGLRHNRKSASVIRSARASSIGGTSRPSAFPALNQQIGGGALEDAAGRGRKLTSHARKGGNSPNSLSAVTSKTVGPEEVSVASEEDRHLKIGHRLNQWPQRHLLVKILCDALQDARVRQRERPFRPREHSHSPKPRHRLVGVHERQTERIRDVLLL